MKAKKRINLSIPLWWPSGPGWRRLARAMTPHPGTLIVMLVVLAAILWAQSVGALPLRAPAAAGTSTGTIAYQGRLADAEGNPLTNTYPMIFRLYDVPTGGVYLWESGLHQYRGRESRNGHQIWLQLDCYWNSRIGTGIWEDVFNGKLSVAGAAGGG